MPKSLPYPPQFWEGMQGFTASTGLFCIGYLTLDRTVNNVKKQVSFLVSLLPTPVFLLDIKRILSPYLYEEFLFSCLFYAYIIPSVDIYYETQFSSEFRVRQERLNRFSKKDAGENFERWSHRNCCSLPQKKSVRHERHESFPTIKASCIQAG